MKQIIITGPQAVGKMTVGHELQKISELKLFHNHMTIDLVSPIFSYGSEVGQKLVYEFRFRIFEEVSKSDNIGIIFTYLWAFDEKEDHNYIEKIISLFEKNNHEVYIVELETSIEERLLRNKDDFRLSKKESKRNIKMTEKFLLADHKNHRLNSKPGEIKRTKYLRIDNTKISAKETAQIIKNKFGL